MADAVDDDVLWNDKGGGGEGREISLASGEMQQTLLLDSGNGNVHVDFSSFRSPDDTSMSSYFKSPDDTSRSSYEDAAAGSSKRSKLVQQGGSAESSEEESSPLGLSLRKTPSFINLLETKLNETRHRKPIPCPSTSAKQHKMQDPMTDKDDKLENEKLKASNFPALHLKIGSWERSSRHEGDLVAKCYYKKGRLVWEVLEGALKSKIEIQWSDIIGIRASKADDETGILEIELNEKPLFFKETNPQPRKHTLWQQADDFTGGQALICRRHYVRFAPGTLDKHYERLLQYDQRLFMLSKMPFPSKPSHFPEYQIDFNGYGSYIHNPTARYHYYQSFPASMASPPLPNMRPTGRPQFPSVDQNPTMPASNLVLDNQNLAFLNEATNIATGNYVQVARPIASVVLSNLDFPNYPNMGYPNQDLNAITQGQVAGISTPTAALLDIQNHLLGDHMQAASQRSVSARAHLFPVEVARGRMINEQAMQNTGENSSVNDGLVWSDSNWLPQYNRMAIQPSSTNTSFYPYDLQNQTSGNF